MRPRTPTAARGPDFRHGLASGGVTPTSFRLWCCPTRAGRLAWEVRSDDGDPVVAAMRSVRAGPFSAPVIGLVPGTRYGYRVRLDGGPWSDEATATTLPGHDAAELDIAIACCARLPSGDFEVYGRLADHRPDLVVHLGDYIYEDGEAPHEPRRTCVTADEYATRYAQYRTDPDLLRLHAAAPFVTVWDDHDVSDDAWRGGVDDPSPRQRSWERRRADAFRAHTNWLTQGAGEPGPTPFDRRVPLGPLGDLVVVDARHAGRSRPVDASGGPTLVDPERTAPILTDEQWDWLADCVDASAGWFLLATQTQVSPLRLAVLPDPRRRFRPTPFVNPGQWDGYPAERRRLGELLARLAGRVTVLSGDLHGRFVTSFDSPAGPIPEITTPSVASTPFATAVRNRAPIPEPVLRWWLQRRNPHVTDLDLTAHGASLLHLEPDELVLGNVGRDGDGPSWRLRRGSTRWQRLPSPH